MAQSIINAHANLLRLYHGRQVPRTLYTGMTNDLERRVFEHKHQLTPGFTSKYNINRLVHIETFSNARDAIQREKQIKGWLRARKVALIVSENPAWKDLSKGWFGKE